MNNFFTNLVNRHLGNCDTIQPRIPGRFEPDHGSTAMASPVQNTDLGIPASEATKQAPETFFPGSPETTTRHPDAIENREDLFPPSLPEHDVASVEGRLSQSGTPLFADPPTVSPLLDSNRHSPPETPKQRQMDNPLPVFSHGPAADRPEPSQVNKADETAQNHLSPAAAAGGEHMLEGTLNQRIETLLQRLTEVRGRQKNGDLLSASSEKKTSPPNTHLVSPDQTPALEPLPEPPDENSADERENRPPPGQRETPAWLSEMEARLNQNLKEKKSESEPVINVTIGRIEVRAVQKDKPDKTQQTRKPTGVMTLDEYLKRREEGGSR